MPRLVLLALCTLPALVGSGCGVLSRAEPERQYYATCGGPTTSTVAVLDADIRVRPLGADSLHGFDWEAIAGAAQYAEMARRAGVESEVQAVMWISPEGEPTAVQVSGSPYGFFREEAERVLRAATYAPAPGRWVFVEAAVEFRLR